MIGAGRALVLMGGLCVPAALLLPAASAARFGPQTPAQARPRAADGGTAQLSGVVVTSEGGSERPLRRVTVRLLAPEIRTARVIATDDAGRFLFTDLPAGRYSLSATRAGFLPQGYGAQRPGGQGTPIPLADGQQASGFRLRMTRGAVIAGTVRDPYGQAADGVRIELLQVTTVAGRRVLARTASRGESNSRGAYRIFGLAPGEYVVATEGNIDGSMATALRLTTEADLQWAASESRQAAATSAPPAAPRVILSRVYFPGTTDAASATPLMLGAGEERLGVDLALRYVPVVRVSGVATMPDGVRAGGTMIVLLPAAHAADVLTVRDLVSNRTTTSANGEFTFGAVEAGNYLLAAQASSGGGRGASGGRGGGSSDLWARVPVAVGGGDVTDVAVSLRPGFEFPGRVVIDPAATGTPPALPDVRVTLTASQTGGIALGVQPAQISADGAFALRGVAPGSYLVSVSVPPGPPGEPRWIVKSIDLQSQDVLDRSIEVGDAPLTGDLRITLTNRAAEIRGRLIDTDGSAAASYTVILFPVAREFWATGLARSPRAVRPDRDGTFRFPALTPGEYFIAVATDFNPRDLATDAFLDPFVASAVKVSVGAGEQRVQDLRIGRER